MILKLDSRWRISYEKFDVVFKNGKIVTENGVEECDIDVADGKISEIGKINAEAETVEMFLIY